MKTQKQIEEAMQILKEQLLEQTDPQGIALIQKQYEVLKWVKNN